MKKLFLTLVLGLAVMLSSGCEPNQQNPDNSANDTNIQNTETENTDIENDYKKKVKPVGNNPPVDTEGFTPMGRYEFDMDGDGSEDTITLYTSAQRDMQGNMMWDDSQLWVLQAELEEKKGLHTLFSNRIGGMVYMNVSDYYNEGEEEKVVTLIISSNTFHEIREYRYDDTLDGACFTERTVFTTDDMANEGIGNLYSSIPDYE